MAAFSNDDFHSVDVKDVQKETIHHSTDIKDEQKETKYHNLDTGTYPEGIQKEELSNMTINDDTTLRSVKNILDKYNSHKKSSCSYLSLLLTTCKTELEKIKKSNDRITQNEISKMIRLIGEITKEIVQLNDKMYKEKKLNKRMGLYMVMALAAMIGAALTCYFKKK